MLINVSTMQAAEGKSKIIGDERLTRKLEGLRTGAIPTEDIPDILAHVKRLRADLPRLDADADPAVKAQRARVLEALDHVKGVLGALVD